MYNLEHFDFVIEIVEMMKNRRILKLLILSGLLWPMSVAFAVPGPREPLTFRDSGLYVGPTPYLERSDTPFNFAIVPAAPTVGKAQTVTTWNESFKKIRRSGKRVIVDFCIYDVDEKGKTKGITSGLSIDRILQGVDEFFAQVDVNEVYAITLSEENIFWNGQMERLNILYDKIKTKYPNLPVYQWYSGSSEGSAPGDNWPNLKADGWVADEYYLDQPFMERTMRHFTVLQKPFIQLGWAGGEKNSVPFITKRFWEQIEVCRKYNIPTAYFTWYGEGGSWGFEENAPASLRKIFKTVFQTAQRAKSETFEVRDATAWDWVPWEIPILKLAFKSRDHLTASYSEPFRNLDKERGLQFVNHAVVKGFANLRWDSSPMEFRLRQAGNAESSVSYTFESPFKISQLNVTAGGFVAAGKDTVASMSVLDANGKLIKTTNFTQKPEALELVIPGTDFRDRVFKVVFHMSGKAGAGGEVLAGISSLDVEAKVVLPKKKVIEIPTADALGRVVYEEDLRSTRIYHTAEFVNGEYLKYSTSGLHAVVAPGKTLEVIQKFQSSQEIDLTGLSACGIANEAGLGARMGLGISLNGRDLLAKKMSSGAFKGDLEVDLSELKKKLQTKVFYVHLFLEGTAGVISSYTVDGKIVK